MAIGAMFILIRSQLAFEYASESALPRNHRVLASDLRAPDLAWALAPGLRPKSDYAGRYLDRSVASGEPMKHEYLKDRPAPVAVQGTRAYGWLLREGEKQWSQILDVGWAVDLCADNCPVMGAPVLAVDCTNPSAGACVVVLQLTPDQTKTLLEYPSKQKLSMAVSRVDLGGRK